MSLPFCHWALSIKVGMFLNKLAVHPPVQQQLPSQQPFSHCSLHSKTHYSKYIYQWNSLLSICNQVQAHSKSFLIWLHYCSLIFLLGVVIPASQHWVVADCWHDQLQLNNSTPVHLVFLISQISTLTFSSVCKAESCSEEYCGPICNIICRKKCTNISSLILGFNYICILLFPAGTWLISIWGWI